MSVFLFVERLCQRDGVRTVEDEVMKRYRYVVELKMSIECLCSMTTWYIAAESNELVAILFVEQKQFF